jgi:hypothetical protein
VRSEGCFAGGCGGPGYGLASSPQGVNFFIGVGGAALNLILNIIKVVLQFVPFYFNKQKLSEKLCFLGKPGFVRYMSLFQN